MEKIRGKSALRLNVQSWMKAFPDVSGDLASAVLSEREAALLVHFSGTNRGPIEIVPGRSIPATNKKVEMPLGLFFTFNENGKIVKERDLYDVQAYISQLGVRPEQMGIGQGVGSASRPSTSQGNR